MVIDEDDDIFLASLRSVTENEHLASSHARALALSVGADDLHRVPVSTPLPHVELLTGGIEGWLERLALDDPTDYDLAVAAAASQPEAVALALSRSKAAEHASLQAVHEAEPEARERMLAQARTEASLAARIQADAAAARPQPKRPAMPLVPRLENLPVLLWSAGFICRTKQKSQGCTTSSSGGLGKGKTADSEDQHGDAQRTWLFCLCHCHRCRPLCRPSLLLQRVRRCTSRNQT